MITVNTPNIVVQARLEPIGLAYAVGPVLIEANIPSVRLNLDPEVGDAHFMTLFFTLGVSFVTNDLTK